MTAESFQGQLVLTWKVPCSNQGSEGRERDVPGVAGLVKWEASGKRRVFRSVFSNLSCSSKAFISRPTTSCSSMFCNMCVKRCVISVHAALGLYIIPNGLLGVIPRLVMRLTCRDVPIPLLHLHYCSLQLGIDWILGPIVGGALQLAVLSPIQADER